MTTLLILSAIILSILATLYGFVTMADPEGRGGLRSMFILGAGFTSTVISAIWLIVHLASSNGA